MKKKIVSLALAVAMCFSLLTFTAPFAGAVYIYNPEPTAFHGFVSALTGFVSTGLEAGASGKIDDDAIYDIVNSLSIPYTGECTMEQLEYCAQYYNESLVGRLNGAIGMRAFEFKGHAAPRYQAEHDIYRLYDHAVGAWVIGSDGGFPYVDASKLKGDVPAGEQTDNVYSARWCSASGAEITNNISRTSYEALSAKQLELSEWGHPCSLYKTKIGPKGKEVECWTILDEDWYYYCDQNGNRYAAVIEPSVTETVRPSIDNSGNLIEGDNGLILDVEDNVLNLIGQLGDQFRLNIDDMVFDFGTNSYTVNAYTTVNEGDNYYYTYYTYNIQYNITNTYITYIGSNDAYEREEYELYYQLPDGRSSADLTAEEVAGMSFEFYDVMNYQRSTDDVSVRSLYHFDGNTDDDSYFSGQSFGFTWLSGASITYMESPSPFGGNLYLDNTNHSFSIDLPSNLSSGDYTIQFRYYQASEPDTLSNVENSLSVDGITLLKWDEGFFYNGDGISFGAALPVGTWNEIALIRSDGIQYVYLNGVCLGNNTFSHPLLKDTLTFNFGSTSRAYSMIDEFRVLNFAYVSGGDYYSPTVVPHDNNLVLVLPGAERPIADEYFVITSSGSNILNYTVETFTSGVTPDLYPFYFDSSLLQIEAKDGYTEFTRLSQNRFTDYMTFPGYDLSSTCSGFADGLHFPACYRLGANTDYVLSVVTGDGEVYSMPFNSGSFLRQNTYFGSNIAPYAEHCRVDFPGGSMSFVYASSSYNHSSSSPAHRMTDYLSISFGSAVGDVTDILYIELVVGTSTDLACEKITSVYDAVDLRSNTAAIQTTIPVNGYTVGGIRPSIPSRGDLWFPVMENRITSVQIYTGTHWEEVNARWWTGSRWIPIYAFDINTLEDLFDIADGDSTVPLLPDQNSFLRWWQLQWLDFRNWLENALSNSGSGGGTSLPDDETLPGEDATDEEDGWSFIDLLVKTKDGIWKITKGIVRTAAGGITGLVVLINDAGNFFEPFQGGYTDGVGDLMNYGGDDIWD